MAPRGFDISAVVRNPALISTLGVSFVAWFIAFIGQCVGEAQAHRSSSLVVDGDVVNVPGSAGSAPRFGVLWFAIWVQILVIVFFLISAANGSLAQHRFALTIFTAICLVFSVTGVQRIFEKGSGAVTAAGVGWLLLCMVDIVWLLFLTADEDSWLFYTFGSGTVGGWGGAPAGTRRHSGRASRAEAGIYGSESSGLRHNGADRGMSSHELTSNGYNNMGYSTPINLDGPSPSKLPAASSPQPEFASAMGQSTDTVAYKHKAKANYAYQASPDDPNEVSFAKGEILEVHDTTGKWYQVRTANGQTGIAPSNYLTLL